MYGRGKHTVYGEIFRLFHSDSTGKSPFGRTEWALHARPRTGLTSVHDRLSSPNQAPSTACIPVASPSPSLCSGSGQAPRASRLFSPVGRAAPSPLPLIGDLLLKPLCKTFYSPRLERKRLSQTELDTNNQYLTHNNPYAILVLVFVIILCGG